MPNGDKTPILSFQWGNYLPQIEKTKSESGLNQKHNITRPTECNSIIRNYDRKKPQLKKKLKTERSYFKEKRD